MWRLVGKWGTGVLIISCVFSTMLTDAALAVSGWSSGAATVEDQMTLQYIPDTQFSCPSRARYIAVKGWYDPKLACVYGSSSGLQAGRFIGSTGSAIFALKFTNDSEFVTFRGMCVVLRDCAYAQSEDTLVVRSYEDGVYGTALIRQFSRSVEYHPEDGGFYQLKPTYELTFVKKGSRAARTNAFAVSENGAWAVVETYAQGILRVNLRTLETRRVVAPTGEYGYGTDPGYELAISNSGSQLAVVGYRVGLRVYDIVPGCGDEYLDSSGSLFAYYTPACPAAPIDYYTLFPGFRDAHLPEFSSDGMRLSMYLVTATQQRLVTLAAPGHASSAIAPQYTAFGDSYTSGEGELDDKFYLLGTNTSDNHCHVSLRSYPYLIGDAWDVPTISRACSGARIPDVLKASSVLADEERQHKVTTPSHISIGIGGNDLNIIGKLKTCLMPGTCEWARPEKRVATATEVQNLFPKLIDAIQIIKKNQPNAALSIVGYPSVVNTTTSASCDMVTDALLNREERTYLEETVKYLNVILRVAATASSIPYFDIEQALVGERLCDSHSSAMNGVRFGDDIGLGSFKVIGNESFHPTPWGHVLVAQAILSKSERPWSVQSCDNCVVSGDALAPSDYWRQTGSSSNSVVQKFKEFLSSSVLRPKSSVTVTFSPGSFMPFSLVRFELHSSPIELGTATSAEDGSLTYIFQVPEDYEGYHTVHALAESQSHEALDLYQTVLIGDEKPILSIKDPLLPFGNSGGSSTIVPTGSKHATAVKKDVVVARASVETESAKNKVSSLATMKLKTPPSTASTQRVSSPPWQTVLSISGVSLGVCAGIGWYAFRKIKSQNYSEELP